ncbi:hypothetical protein [Streptococcus sp. S784/96/1]|uniref:hypothetical protein n=1 Tax=Streptococcus sp. S784/96/1 TaxID=2653499 RepID=UPI001386A70E|nr:hypothetical protein [Streptococcus sp. S784/96/1]
MDIAVKIITFIGVLGGISGLFWMMGGVYEYFQGRKNRDRNRQDDGAESIINGAGLALASGAVAGMIVAAMQSLTF